MEGHGGGGQEKVQVSKQDLQARVYGSVRAYVDEALPSFFGDRTGPRIVKNDLIRLLNHRNPSLVPKLQKGTINWNCSETDVLNLWITALALDAEAGGCLPEDQPAKDDSSAKAPAATASAVPAAAVAAAQLRGKALTDAMERREAKKDLAAWRSSTSARWSQETLGGGFARPPARTHARPHACWRAQ